jgi:putative hemolysin
MREITYALVIVVLFFCSAFFSSSETALFSLSRVVVSRLKKEKRSGAARVERLKSNPQELLGTLLTGNLLVNVTASSLFTLLVITFVHRFNLNANLFLILGAVCMTLLLLIGGEITPKIIAVRRPESIGLFAAPILSVLQKVLFPVTFVLSRLGSFLPKHPKPFPTEDELKTMLELGRKAGVLLTEEEEIIYNLVELQRRTAVEVMTPRIEIVGIEKGSTVRETLALIKQARRSRLPVYEKTRDHITGILYIKDLIGKRQDALIDFYVRPAYFIPESKNLFVLLEEFRRNATHIAIVIDEFGQTGGLVTLEDILEGIFGEIIDEYDLKSELPLARIGPFSYLADGDVDLKTLNRVFRRAFKGVDFDRLSGFITHQLGRFPKPGEKFDYKNLSFEIKSVHRHRIEKVLIRKVS